MWIATFRLFPENSILNLLDSTIIILFTRLIRFISALYCSIMYWFCTFLSLLSKRFNILAYSNWSCLFSANNSKRTPFLASIARKHSASTFYGSTKFFLNNLYLVSYSNTCCNLYVFIWLSLWGLFIWQLEILRIWISNKWHQEKGNKKSFFNPISWSLISKIW
jgi:hypothetical protein